MDEYGRITLGGLLDCTAANFPNKKALIYPDRELRFSYKTLREACDSFAKGLLGLGVERGENIAILATNVPEWVITQYGSSKIGAVLVTVNTHFKMYELENQLRQSDATTLIMVEGIKNDEYIRMLYDLCPELNNCNPGELTAAALPCLKNVIVIGNKKHSGMYTWDDIINIGKASSEEELATRMAELDPNDVIHMIYTSGSTGVPKGVMLTHHNLITNAIRTSECMKLSSADRLCIPVPFFHCFGCVAGTMCCVATGATMVIPSKIFNPEQTLQVIEQERCTALHGTPTMFIMELDLLRKRHFDTSSLRTGLVAGASCSPEVMEKIVEVMKVDEILVAYGQTEASPGITTTRTNDPLEMRIFTAGRALPGVEVKIFDPDTDQEVPPGVQGEIRARGFNIMRGYYKMPEETAVAIDEDGWLYTGDLGALDENGYLKINCRIKDMIIRGGENVYPKEVENFLVTHPAIKDAQVIGVPSARYGEEVMAFLQLKEGRMLTPKEVQQFCKGQIASCKIPEYVTFVDSFPLSGSGKILKYKLQEMITEQSLKETASTV
ncbi:MAG: CaiC [Firmicutes bacterium]|nr:CaiC [Bacillota bacterium]MBP2659246.1 CaiC [Bacillota bacterium]